MARSNPTANRLVLALVPAAALALAALLSCAAADSGRRAPASRYGVEWVCDEHGDRVRALFAALDLGRPGMQAVRDAVDDGDWEDACRALVSYYEDGTGGSWLRLRGPTGTEPTDERGDRILGNAFTFHGRDYTVPRTATGEIDWTTRGPDDDPEWTAALNRHFHLPWLMRAYLRTGKTVYTDRLCDQIVDWVQTYPYPEAFSTEVQWDGHQVAARVPNWAEVFYGLQAFDDFAPGARILMLAGVYDHARYLSSFHRDLGNWAAKEMVSLGEIAVAWPEFADAPAWLGLSRRVMKEQMDAQVYPDGAQKELTISYHVITVKHFENFVQTLARGGVDASADFAPGIERMWNYVAYTMRPDGYGPMNNDSDHDAVRDDLLAGAERYRRPDWRYIATGAEAGAEPEDPPSRVFPWSGQVVMRDGWERDAHWAFFDVGPAGTAHQHADKLHLSVTAYGRDLLVDPGRYIYKPGPDFDYFRGSAGHNVILIDGAGQALGAAVAGAPLSGDDYAIEPAFDFARAGTDAGFAGIEGTAAHTRTVVYVRGRLWVVVDHVDTDRPRELQALWHYHPACSVEVQGTTVASVDTRSANLRIVPASNLEWRADVVVGQTEPAVQGWYSERYGEKVAAPTAVFRARVDGPATFAWVLVPAPGTARRVTARLETDRRGDVTVVTIDGLGGARPLRVRVPMRSGIASIEQASTE